MSALGPKRTFDARISDVRFWEISGREVRYVKNAKIRIKLRSGRVKNFTGETSFPYCSPKLCRFIAISRESGRCFA